MIELRQLRNFVVVCRHTNLAQAAASLGVSSSTLSTGLKSLERTLGTPLFRRSTSGLYPMPSAARLFRIACGILQIESYGRRSMRAPKRSTSAILTVDVRLDFAFGRFNNALTRAIQTIANSNPTVLVDVRWSGEPDSNAIATLFEGLAIGRRGRVVIEIRDEADDRGRSETTLFADPWALGCRLPADTKRPTQAKHIIYGHDYSIPVIVPALQHRLVDQVRIYLRDFEIPGVRYSADPVCSMPIFFKDNPGAAALAPHSLLSAQLGLPNLTTIPLSPPLATTVVAHIEENHPAANAFIKSLSKELLSSRNVSRQPSVIGSKAIRYFNILHRARSVSLAAQAANIVQPAMTDQLRQLESILKVRLFDRRSDGLLLTADGERFVPAAEAIERGLQKIVAGAASAQRLTGDSLKLGILPSVSQHGFLVNKVADAVLAVQARHPFLKLVVMEGATETLQGWVLKGVVGMAIVETGLPNMPRLPLGASEPLMAIAHRRHVLLPKGPVSLAALADVPLALPRSLSGLRQLVDAAGRKQGLSIVPAIEIDGLPMLIAVLNRQKMCAVLPASAVKGEIDRGELIAHQIVEPEIFRTLFVIYSADRSLTEPERDLVRALRNELASPDVVA